MTGTNITPEEDRRRWAIERAITYAGADTTQLFVLADRLVDYANGERGHAAVVHAAQTTRIRWNDGLSAALAEYTAQGLGPKAIGVKLNERFGLWPTPAAVKTRQKKLDLLKTKPAAVDRASAEAMRARKIELAQAAG